MSLPESIEVHIDTIKAKLEFIEQAMVEEMGKIYTQRHNKLIRFLDLERKIYSRTLAELELLLSGAMQGGVEDLILASYRNHTALSDKVQENIVEKVSNVSRRYHIVTAGGIGDTLTLTPVFRTLKQRSAYYRIHVFCTRKSHKEVLKNNPYIDRLVFIGDWGGKILRRLRNRRIIRFQWADNKVLMPDMFYNNSIAELIGDKLGVKIDNCRPDCFLTKEEEVEAQNIVLSYPNPVAIQITAGSSRNKRWPIENWERLVLNNPQYSFLQLGLADEDAIQGAVDLRGKLRLRQLFGVIKSVRALVSVDSSLAHVAAAFNTPAVVIFGPSSPKVWSYVENHNIYKAPRCSPCVQILGDDPCPYEKPCMSNITASDVDRALSSLLNISTEENKS